MDLNLPLTRRRDPDYEARLIFYGDLHVGTIRMRSGFASARDKYLNPMAKIGRNQHCPCSCSGKKYKFCHGRFAGFPGRCQTHYRPPTQPSSSACNNRAI
jgi:hypothetical protein